MTVFMFKKLLLFFINSISSIIVFSLILLLTYDLAISLAGSLMIGIALSFIFSKLLSHPFLQMLEGKGILALTIDSSGVVKPFICRVNPPKVWFKLDGKELDDVWDRNLVFYLDQPQEGRYAIAKGSNGKEYEVLVLGEKGSDKSDKLYNFSGYPLFIYNKQLESFLTKDSLMKFESQTLAKHNIIRLNAKVDELVSNIRDFARYVVEQTKPKKSLLSSSNIIIIMLIIAIITIFVVLLLPNFVGSFIPQPQTPIVKD